MMSIRDRESAIEHAGIRSVFTPRTPINLEDFLVGRNDQLERIVGGLNTPGGHAVIFGDRGVGKTSLANVIREHFAKTLGHDNVHVYRCDSTSSFLNCTARVLEKVGVDLRTKEKTETREEGGTAKVSAVVAGAGIESKRSTKITLPGDSQFVTPEWTVTQIGGYAGLLVIDELDVVTSDDTVISLAIFVKQLSDANASLKVCMVGIADTVGRLLRGHQSAGRALVEVKLDRLSDNELRQIILRGESRSEIRFDDDVVEKIVSVSAGYPYFTHLLALKSAEVTVIDKRRRVTEPDLGVAWRAAAEETEASLHDTYMKAVDYDSNSLRGKVLLTASSETKSEIHIGAFGRRFFAVSLEPKPGATDVQNCLESLLSERTVICRINALVFRFVDPRMPSFIRISDKAYGAAPRVGLRE